MDDLIEKLCMWWETKDNVVRTAYVWMTLLILGSVIGMVFYLPAFIKTLAIILGSVVIVLGTFAAGFIIAMDEEIGKDD